jgi:hypothetical protein
MPSTAEQAEITAYEAVRATPVMRVHGQPTQSNYETLKSNASALEDITYAWSKSATDKYGLLGNIFGIDEYYKFTASPPTQSPWNLHDTAHPSTIRPHTKVNARKRIATSSTPLGSSGKVSSKGSPVTYVTPLTNSTIPS